MRWLVVLILLAGCADAPEPEQAFILLESETADKNRSQSMVCPSTGNIEISAEILSGQVTVQVFDGTDELIFQRPMRGPDNFQVTDSFGGHSGEWDLRVVALDSQGTYSIKLLC